MLILYSYPANTHIELGTLDEFPAQGARYFVHVDKLHFVVVNTGDELYVFSVTTPHRTNYRYKWVPSNNRFEDPLTGSKFTLEGVWIEGPAPRNLDQYAYTVDESGHLIVDDTEIIPGEVHR